MRFKVHMMGIEKRRAIRKVTAKFNVIDLTMILRGNMAMGSGSI